MIGITSLKLLGRTVRVRYKGAVVHSDGTDLHGMYHHNEISIATDSQSIDEQWTTLIHEAAHAWLDLSGLNEILNYENEEMLVRSLEEQFLPIVRALLFAQHNIPQLKSDKKLLRMRKEKKVERSSTDNTEQNTSDNRPTCTTDRGNLSDQSIASYDNGEVR